MKHLRWLSLLALVAASSVARAAPPPIADVRLIAVHPGVNHIPNFAADGRAARIVEAWRGNGNAHGYVVYLILLPAAEGNPFGVVRDDSSGSDVFTEAPFDGERRLSVVRLARARLNGVKQTVLISARLNESSRHVLADHATATVEVYRLVRSDAEPGSTPDYFTRAWSTRTTATYCNVEPVLKAVLGLPLSAGYAGANAKDGCD